MKKASKVDPLKAHRKLGGKIETKAKVSLKKLSDWSTYYTPGVGAVSSHLAKNPKDARLMTVKRNSVAVISDGSAVLGLGNIGPYGALPVMEGKALIFKDLANIDAFPIVLDTQDPDKIVETVIAIAPAFGGINLEDIASPQCFEIERRLKEALDIPVMHDDQHGTAIVVLAALINACEVVKKNIKNVSVTVLGAGAAGAATAKLLAKAGVSDIVTIDREGVIGKHRANLNAHKKELAVLPTKRMGKTFDEVIKGSDVLIALSGGGRITEAEIASMAPKSIVFVLANPVPEIMPENAKKAGAFVIATGRSDFPNQVNNALVFPGVFRGALDRGVKKITDEMKLSAAKALAGLVKKPSRENIVPSVLDRRVTKAVAKAIR